MQPMGTSVGLDPMPGDPAMAGQVPAFAGNGQGHVTPPSPGVQEQLQHAAMQLRAMQKSLDDALSMVQGIATQFPTQDDTPKQIADGITALKKLMTTFVMTTIKQAPQSTGGYQPAVMR